MGRNLHSMEIIPWKILEEIWNPVGSAELWCRRMERQVLISAREFVISNFRDL